MIDGLNIGTPVGGNQPPGYIADIGNAQEITFTTSGGLGESETAGLVMNVVPRTGGNRYSGSIFFSGTGENLQSSNYTEELRLAGPHRRDSAQQGLRLQRRGGRADREGSGVVLRQRPHPGQHPRNRQRVLQPERGRPDQVALLAGHEPAGVLRPHLGERERAHHLAGDAAQQDRRLLGRAAHLPQVRGHDAGPHRSGARLARGHRQRLGHVPGAAGHLVVTGDEPPAASTRASAATTTATVTASANGNTTRNLIRVSEQCAGGCAANGNIPGLVYRSQDWIDAWQGSWNWRASASYVTGAHSLKIGYQGNFLTDDQVWYTNDQQLAYRLNNGVPNQLTHVHRAVPARLARLVLRRLRAGAVDARPAHAAGRAPVRPRATAGSPSSRKGRRGSCRSGFTSTRRRAWTAYNDFSPRVGVAYDLFGNGRTALKGNVGQVPRGRGHSAQLRQPESDDPAAGHGFPAHGDAHLDRRQQQLPARLQPARADAAGSADHRRRLLWRALELAVRPERLHQHLRRGSAARLGCALLGLEHQRVSVQQQLMARMSVEVVVQPALVQRLHGDRQPADAAVRLSRRSASPRRSIRGCPAAAATRSRASTTSRRRSSARSATSSPTRATSASGTSTTTAWT